MVRSLLTAWLVGLGTLAATGAEVTGRIAMPDSCSPGVSPAVAILEPVDRPPSEQAEPAAPTQVALVNQRSLQFTPRVSVMRAGQTLRFTNEDSETHNVHILSRELPFNQSMAPGAPAEVIATTPGVLKVACDVHQHMRAYVIVSDSPWAKACNRDGLYRFRDVPPGRYLLMAWHEMGEPSQVEVVIGEGPSVDLPTITLTAPSVSVVAGSAAPVVAWPEVVDRIGLKLNEAMDAARKPEGARRARTLAEDAYFEDFEGSEMERAVRNVIGFERAGEIEAVFRKLWPLAAKVARKEAPPTEFGDATRQVLLLLARSSEDLRRVGVMDRTHIGMESAAAEAASAPGTAESDRLRVAFARALEQVREQADRGAADEAASRMADAYFAEFEPIERAIAARRPQDVRGLEIEYASVRTAIAGGLKGDDLGRRLAGLRDAVDASLDRAGERSGGFAPAFAASLLTILREGVEVILLLTMLIALVVKTGDQPRARAAIRWGVAGAVVASAITAVGLNLLVRSAQGQTQEMLEGLVMLAAAGVLFYVSYWLISQAESKRWLEFLKDRARRGAELGGMTTLGLTAFLAVYREGAETALLYQALISGQSGSREGLLGLAAGLGVGLVLLGILYVVIRRTSVRLPLRSFFQVSGLLLFGMAVVFAGNGVFELQQARVLKSTPVAWVGGGLPILGIYPNVQALAIQGLLVAGALAAWGVLVLGGTAAPAARTKASTEAGTPATAGVGA